MMYGQLIVESGRAVAVTCGDELALASQSAASAGARSVAVVSIAAEIVTVRWP